MVSFESLVRKAPINVLGSIFFGGIGYFLGESQGAWIAAKVSSAAIGFFYCCGQPEVVLGIPPNSGQFYCRMIGSCITALATGSLTISAIEELFSLLYF